MPVSLGRYRLKRELGHGAMGVVYEGWDDNLHRPVAIKTIRTSQFVDPEVAAEYSRRFIQEAKNAGQLMHPNIVTVFDFGNEAGMDFLVMELIHGKDLKAYFDAGYVFSMPEAVAIACQLLEALAYVHGKNIFHRDVKPANIMLEAATRRVRLTDFGVARFWAGEGLDGTRAGTVVGTPGYMSPEQINGLPVGAGADLFATGVLLYQCLTSQRPFAGVNALEIWHKTANEEPAPMASHRNGIPAALERAVRHALAKEPHERPASARDLIDELQDAIAGESFEDDATRILDIGVRNAGRCDSASQPHRRRADLHSTQGGGAPTGSKPGKRVVTAQAEQAELQKTIEGDGGTDEVHIFGKHHPGSHPIRRNFDIFIVKILPSIGGAALVLLVIVALGGFLARPRTPTPPARLTSTSMAAAVSATRSASLASPVPAVARPVNAEGEVDRVSEGAKTPRQVPRARAGNVDDVARRAHERDRQRATEHDKLGDVADPKSKSKVDIEESAEPVAGRSAGAEWARGTAPAVPTAEANKTDAREDAPAKVADDDLDALQNQQARYMKLAQLAESQGDSHRALALYKHAYDAGSGSDATRFMRNVSSRAAQAMSDIFGSAGARVQQLTWHLNAKTMAAEVANADNR